MFHLYSTYKGQLEILAKIEGVLADFEASPDDKDVTNTILARAGLPPLDSSVPDAFSGLTQLKTTMDANV